MLTRNLAESGHDGDSHRESVSVDQLQNGLAWEAQNGYVNFQVAAAQPAWPAAFRIA